MSVAGNPVCGTPALDRLAGQGTRFNRCFSPNPVCAPARASLLTGTNTPRHGVRRNGIALRRDIPTLADLLVGAGYATAAVGKLHLTPEQAGVQSAPFYGFQQLGYCEDSKIGPYLDWALREFPEHKGYLLGACYNLPPDDSYWQGRRDLRELSLALREQHVLPHEISPTCNWGFGHHCPLPEAATHSSWITNQAIDMLAASEPGKPLFLWVGYVDPHNPFAPPSAFAERYTPDQTDPRLRNEGEEALFTTPMRGCRSYYDSFTEQDWRELRALYYGQVSFMDAQIGRLLAAIEQRLDMKNTIVVYTADHGEHLGDHGIAGKSCYHYDAGIRVPLLMRWDEHWQSNAASSEMIDLTDLTPTLLDAAGLQAPEHLDGWSYTALLEGKKPQKSKDHVFVESYAGGPEDPTPAPLTWARTIRSKQYRVTFYPESREGELFDLEQDPHEFHNLWADPALAPIKEEYRRILCDRLILQDFPLPSQRFNV